MQITIVAVGKMKEKYLLDGVAEYLKRLQAYAKVEIVEVADEKAPERLSAAEMEQVKAREGERILARIPADAHVVALAIEGKMRSSEEFAQMIDTWGTYGKSRIVFVIGGSLGLGAAVLARADELLSFSRMTFPHQLMRLVLVEQVYRGFRIVHGDPYHK